MMRAIRTVALALLASSAFVSFAQAQSASPFDMSAEKPKDAAPVRQPTFQVQPAPVPAQPAAPAAVQAAPVQPAPAAPIAPFGQPAVAPVTPALQPTPPAAVQAAPAPAAPVQASQPTARPVNPQTANSGFQRFVVPFADFGLSGEFDRKTWSIYLTPEQAGAPAHFNLAYQNAIVVAPEESKLSILINNRLVGETPIRSAEKPAEYGFDVPPGLLQAGSNLITFQAEERHRTDCSIESTYELWTDIDPARTYLSFGGPDAARFSRTDGVRAVGVDGRGNTKFDLVVPGLSQPGTTTPLMRLTQGLSILSGMPNQSFAFRTSGLPEKKPGQLTVLVGTASELQPLLPSLPPAAQVAPLATFITDPRNGAPVLLVTGPSWQAVAAATDSLVSPTDRAIESRRDVLATQRWQAPDVPLIFSDTQIPFSQLGVTTAEFAGRRYRTDFGIGVPSDFYANAYGEATILLDAAYAPSVLPGSHIDVYVNGSVASTVPITNKGGGIFRHLPIRVTLRHFRPGLNNISMEAVLLSNDDAICASGTNASNDPRFALFDTSEFHMPDFARVEQRPNLAATAGTGYPYGRTTAPVPLYMDRVDADTMSAAATFLGRVAMMAGRPVPIEMANSPAGVAGHDALFVGTISQIPPAVLTQLNIATSSQATWRPNAEGQAAEVNTGAAFEQWRSKVSGGNWTGQVSFFEEWLRRNFDISFASLRFAPSAESTFTPANSDNLMVAQGISPDGDGTWTVITAPTATDLRNSLTAVATEASWPDISGRITTYSENAKKMKSVPIERFTFVASQGISLSNYRLIAANWLSTNILSYAMLFAGSAVLLGLATAALLSNLGRRP